MIRVPPAFFLVLLGALPASAQDQDDVHPFISNTYTIQFGAFFPSKDFKISVDGSIVGISQEFDWEKATGFSEDDEIFMAEFKWRFGEKWSARLQYYATDQSKKAVLKEDITWRGQGILAGSSVTAGADFSLSRIFFGRSFDRRADVDTGLGLGVHWLEIGAFIKRDLITTFGESSAASVSGPLPNIGGWYYYSPSPKWVVGGRLDWLEASVGKYSGGMTNLSVGANYQLFKNVGIGAAYQLFRLNVDINNKWWRGRAEMDYGGPYLFLSANFK